MPKEQSEPGVHVHLAKDRTGDFPRKKNGYTLVVAVLGCILAGITFFSTYIYATKSELFEVKVEIVGIKTTQNEMRKDQIVQSRNIEKLLERRQITPASRRSLRLEASDE